MIVLTARSALQPVGCQNSKGSLPDARTPKKQDPMPVYIISYYKQQITLKAGSKFERFAKFSSKVSQPELVAKRSKNFVIKICSCS